MANSKISALPTAGAITGTEVVPLVQAGATKAATVQQLLALVIASAPGNLDTFFEVATQIGLDETTVATLQTLVAGKADTATVANTYAPLAGLQAAAKLPPRGTGQAIYTTFAANHGFTVTQGGTASDNLNDTSQAALGSQSLTLVTDGAGTAKRVDKAGGFTIDMSNRIPVLWLKVDASIAHLRAIEVWFGSGGFGITYRLTPHNSVTPNAGLETIQPDKWIRLAFPWNNTTLINTFGAPNRASLNSIRIAVQDDGVAPVTVHFGGVGSMPEPRQVWPYGVVSLTFDDTYSSQWTIAKQKMDQYGFPGTAYTIADLVGQAGRLSLQQLRDMQNSSGWQIAAHAYTVAAHNTAGGYPGLTDTALAQEFRLLKQWGLDNGFQDWEDFAYPQGYFDDRTITQVQRYFRTSRSTINRTQETWPPAEPHKMRTQLITSTTTVGQVQAWIDDAYTNAYWLILVAHSLDDVGAAGGNSFPTASFNAVIDYLGSKGIPVATVADVLAGRRLPRGAAPALAPGGTEDLYLNGGHAATTAETFNRLHATSGVAMSTGTLRLTRFTAAADVTVSNLSFATGGTAGATLTLARLGLYQVNTDGSQTLLAASLSDTTMGTAASTLYTKPFDTGGSLPTSYRLKRGQRYAFGILFTGTTMPNVVGCVPAAAGITALAPQMAQQLNSQTDLPTSIANGAASNINNLPYGYLS